jgi:hypothetical protein
MGLHQMLTSGLKRKLLIDQNKKGVDWNILDSLYTFSTKHLYVVR